jgi:UDP-2,3-diacylglucosamine pyrophosphatase LpxH
MRFSEFLDSFDSLLVDSPREKVGEGERLVVVSDLHLGNGGSRDDLEHNRGLVESTLRNYYLERGWKLVLNGDIEDLSKFRLGDISSAWKDLYGTFGAFHERGDLRKIVGNHDLRLRLEKGYPWPLLDSLLLDWRGKRLVLFHGHQASGYYLKHDRAQDFFLRYLARPLGIMNRSVAHDSRKRFKTERKIYRAAKMNGLVAITGHTHRPLFESFSKWDSLRWSIERLLDDYSSAQPWLKPDIRELIEIYREELERMRRKDRRQKLSRSLYDSGSLPIPCYFNSGTAIGRHGYTALEIAEGSIALVFWAGEGARDYIARESAEREPLEGSPYTRYVMRQDRLERVFDRIELLAPRRFED